LSLRASEVVLITTHIDTFKTHSHNIVRPYLIRLASPNSQDKSSLDAVRDVVLSRAGLPYRGGTKVRSAEESICTKIS